MNTESKRLKRESLRKLEGTGILRHRFLWPTNFTSIENKFSLTERRKNFHDDWRKEKLIDRREAYCGVRLTAHFPRLTGSATFHNIDAKDGAATE